MAASDTEAKFQAALKFITELPASGPAQPSNADRLQFYALFKQATKGKNTTKRPGMLNMVGRAKWDAWKKLGSLSSEQAKQRYVDTIVAFIKSNLPNHPQAQAALAELEGGSGNLRAKL